MATAQDTPIPLTLKLLREQFEEALQAVKGPRHITKQELVHELLPQLRWLRKDGYCFEAIVRLLEQSGFSIRPQTLQRCMRASRRSSRSATHARAKRRAAAPQPAPDARRKPPRTAGKTSSLCRQQLPHGAQCREPEA